MPIRQNTSTKKRIAIGVSGSGTTFFAIAEAINTGKLNCEIAFVFADRKCPALEKAEKLGINIVQKEESEELNKFHERVLKKLKEKQIDIVALAGYLKLFPITKDDAYIVLNSHPAAIPYFGGEGMWGARVHKAVIQWAKDTNFQYPYTFSTIHIASAEYDRGPVLGIKRCEIERNDTAESLSARLLPLEHENYLETLRKTISEDLSEADYPIEFLDLAS